MTVNAVDDAPSFNDRREPALVEDAAASTLVAFATALVDADGSEELALSRVV